MTTEVIPSERSAPLTPIIRWWVVANPRRWKWRQLFDDGQIRFGAGKWARHFPRLQVGDLVVGYQSASTHRLIALARVSKPFGVHEEGAAASFELAPVCLFTRGVDFSDVRANPVLRLSEPMRNRNQGTLFALTADESEQVLRLLESDAAAKEWLEAQARPRTEDSTA
jgi:5-methylcytosine-specific restriction protein B